MNKPMALLLFLLVGAALGMDYWEQATRRRILGGGWPLPHPGVVGWVLIGITYLLVHQ